MAVNQKWLDERKRRMDAGAEEKPAVKPPEPVKPEQLPPLAGKIQPKKDIPRLKQD
jgi:hypothetical protein